MAGLGILARRSLGVVMGTIMAQGIAILVLPIFSRLVDAEDFGRFGIWLAATAICAVLSGSKIQIPIVNDQRVENIVQGAATAMIVATLVAALLVGLGLLLDHSINHLMASWTPRVYRRPGYRGLGDRGQSMHERGGDCPRQVPDSHPPAPGDRQRDRRLPADRAPDACPAASAWSWAMPRVRCWGQVTAW